MGLRAYSKVSGRNASQPARDPSTAKGFFNSRASTSLWEAWVGQMVSQAASRRDTRGWKHSNTAPGMAKCSIKLFNGGDPEAVRDI